MEITLLNGDTKGTLRQVKSIRGGSGDLDHGGQGIIDGVTIVAACTRSEIDTVLKDVSEIFKITASDLHKLKTVKDAVLPDRTIREGLNAEIHLLSAGEWPDTEPSMGPKKKINIVFNLVFK